jgi:uncharacterized protein (DUF433 family)
MAEQDERERQLDWSGCELVESVPGTFSGVPVLKGTRMPVQRIIDNYDAGRSEKEITETLHVTLDPVVAILDYREEFFRYL